MADAGFSPEAPKAWDWLMEQGQGSAQLVMPLQHMVQIIIGPRAIFVIRPQELQDLLQPQ